MTEDDMHRLAHSMGLALVSLLTLSGAALAQRRCVKGIPCGGTCISATKTCHVGSAPAPRSDESTSRERTLTYRAGGVSAAKTRVTAPFVGSATGHYFYPVADCDAASEIPESLRVYFASERAATLLRYERGARCE